MAFSKIKDEDLRIAVVGGGIAGSTAAQILARQPQMQVSLFEQGSSLVSGPPICHLHAGGNLYREIPESECLTLLDESIDTLKHYPEVANRRPTVLAVPVRDPGTVSELLPRLCRLRAHYQARVDRHPADAVLGDPAEYFTLVSREQAERLAALDNEQGLNEAERWLWPLCQSLALDSVKWPLVLVQEYGLSLFRLAASAQLALDAAPNCQVHLDTRIVDVQPLNPGWRLVTAGGKAYEVDVLVNACGFQAAALDGLAGRHTPRLVEFKAAYLAQWPVTAYWPEVIFHGQRGTPEGMAQLTPYEGDLFQLHGMTDRITLFEGGLGEVNQAELALAPEVLAQIQGQWPEGEAERRTRRAIAHLAHFLPGFAQAEPGGQPLAGAQQIPGQDPERRAAGLSLYRPDYACLEIVKANSAVPAAETLRAALCQQHGIVPSVDAKTSKPSPQQVVSLARRLARQRRYPEALALPYGNAEPRSKPCPAGAEF